MKPGITVIASNSFLFPVNFPVANATWVFGLVRLHHSDGDGQNDQQKEGFEYSSKHDEGFILSTF